MKIIDYNYQLVVQWVKNTPQLAGWIGFPVRPITCGLSSLALGVIAWFKVHARY